MSEHETAAQYIAQHGNSDDYEPIPAKEPTDYRVGSWDRLELMRLRAEAGQELWHPDDERQFAEPSEHGAMKTKVNRLFRDAREERARKFLRQS
jgi:hypothetical protein